MAATGNPLTCKQCGYANEGERVYCHNCGTKLDRTLLPEPAEPEESLQKKQKRIRKIVMPDRGFFVGAGKMFVITMLSSIVTAMVLLMLMPPDDVPAMKERKDLTDTRQISMEFEDALQANTPMAIPPMTESDINDFLLYTIKPKPSDWLGDWATLNRVFTNLDEDQIRISVEEKIFGLPVYDSVYYKLSMKDNKLQATVKGGNIGRLQIHPNLVKNIAFAFDNLWVALARNKKQLDHCQSVDVHKGHVDVITLPTVEQ